MSRVMAILLMKMIMMIIMISSVHSSFQSPFWSLASIINEGKTAVACTIRQIMPQNPAKIDQSVRIDVACRGVSL